MERKIKKILTCRSKNCIDDPRWKRAAVLITLFKKEGEYHILFTRRTDNVEHHKGQISFPGGRQDLEDQDLLSTALREAKEEMGIQKKDVRILASISTVLEMTNRTANLGEADDKLLVAVPRHGCWGVRKP